MATLRTFLYIWATAVFVLCSADRARPQDLTDRSWVFATSGAFLGWRAENAVVSGVDSGYLWSESGASPGYFVQEMNLAARKDHYVEIRLRLRPKASPSARFAATYAGIYFTTDTAPSFDEAKKATFRTYGTGTWKTYNIWVGNHALWQGTIKRIRVDPTTTPNARIEIQSVKIIQDRTGPEFILKNNWTYSDNDTISYNTPSLVLVDTYDKVSDISRVDFYRRPAGSTDSDWVFAGSDIDLVGTWQFKYPALPDGSYDLGVRAYDQSSNPTGWDHPQAVIHNLTINASRKPTIDVNAAGPAQPVNRMIAGNNEIWFKWSDRYDPVTNSLDSNLEALFAQCGISIIRYPGGCHADTFYWKQSIGPVASRPSQYANPCGTAVVNNGPAKFGLDEFLRWCEARNIEPMITARFRWPTAAGAPGLDGPQPYLEALNDAVDLVEYCNAPNDGSNWNGGIDWAAMRAANGHPAPYHLKYIEIGNEPYNPDPWGSPGLVGLDGPSEYSLAFLSYQDAIKAIDPGVIVAPSAYLDFHGSNYGSLVNNWPYQVLSVDGPFIEQAQFHKSYPFSQKQQDIVRLYNETMATSKAFEDAFSAYRIIQKQSDPDRTDLIKMQLNEWGVNYYWFNDPLSGSINMEHVRTWKAGLAIADTLRVFLLNRDILSVACFWLMQDDRWGLVQSDNVTPNPAWYIFSTFHEHFGTKLIPAKFTASPTFDWDGWGGNTPPLYNVPKLTGMASLSDDGQTAYLWVINKDRNSAITSSVNLTGFLRPGQTRLAAEIWEMNSNNVDDYTTKRNVYRNITTSEYDPTFSYTFPAHSLTSFKFKAATMSIGAAKLAEAGAAVSLHPSIVTAVFPGHLYVEEPDRSSGVKVLTNASFSVGEAITVAGALDASGDEIAIAAGFVAPAGAIPMVRPVAVANDRLGGSAHGRQSGVEGGVGLSNIALLVRICGKVTQIGADYLYLDDGSGLDDGTLTGPARNVGVRVVCDPAGYVEGQYLVGTGISSCFRNSAGQMQRRLLVRNTADIQSDPDLPLVLARVSDVRFVPEGSVISLSAKKVTSAFGGFFYVEELDRSSGIRVVSDKSVTPGDLATIIGRTVVADGELQVSAMSVVSQPDPALIAPLALASPSLGGAALGLQPGVAGGVGLTNVGLLVRVSGRVTRTATGYLYLDDGSGLRDGTATGSHENVGVRVLCDSTGYVAGDFLGVTGVSSCFRAPAGEIARRLLTRSGDDIVAHRLVDGVYSSAGELKLSAAGRGVTLESSVVTATAEQMGGFLYVENSDRAAGVRVGSGQVFSTGSMVRATGTLSVLSSGEVEVSAASLDFLSNADPLAALGTSLSVLRGGPMGLQRAVAGGWGLNTIGLLVHIAGRVTFMDPGGQFFNIWDGSSVKDSDGRDGVRVWAPGTIPQDLGVGEFAMVTGISSCYKAGEELYPLVRVRESGDIQSL